jgi:hypothetical protein
VVIAGMATSARHAIGDEVQAHLAGQIPDQASPQPCRTDTPPHPVDHVHHRRA